MRFGLGITASAAAETDPAAAARRAEELGFDFVSTSDHPAGTTPTNEAWTMLCFVAVATSRIHVATRVLGVPYRSPALLAKTAETLDRLSNGRLILGLGGGSADDAHRQFGLGVRSPAEKTTGLEEAVTIVGGLWTHASFSFDGRLYRVEAAEVEPKPRRAIPSGSARSHRGRSPSREGSRTGGFRPSGTCGPMSFRRCGSASWRAPEPPAATRRRSLALSTSACGSVERSTTRPSSLAPRPASRTS